jgi:hypothetical protein
MCSQLYNFEPGANPLLTSVMVTSGSFVIDSPYRLYAPKDERTRIDILSAPEISNPMFPRAPEARIMERTTAEFIGELKEAHKDARVIDSRELAGYADRLVDIGKRLAREPIDLMIVPFRGGLTPSLQLQVMNQFHYPCLPVGFSAGSQEKHQKEIEEYLASRLDDYAWKSDLRIGVVDTAIRGDGSLSLAQILLGAKRRFERSRWLVNFHLLYAEDGKYEHPVKADGIPGLSTGEIIFALNRHPVPSLLVEDWDEGIGLRAVWENGICVYKRTAGGSVIAKQPDGKVLMYQSSELPRLIDSMLSNSVTEAIVSDPSLRQKPT